jgi:hypothetical protein
MRKSLQIRQEGDKADPEGEDLEDPYLEDQGIDDNTDGHEPKLEKDAANESSASDDEEPEDSLSVEADKVLNKRKVLSLPLHVQCVRNMACPAQC